jgi:hypothetical protein
MTGTSTLNHASPAQGSMQVLAAVGFPGTDKGAVASVSRAPGSSSVASALVNIVTLGGTATVPTAAVMSTGLTITSGTSAAPNALAYCPVSGSAASVADVLFVAVGASTSGGSDGSIQRITGASGSSAAVGTAMTVTGTGADFQDVRVDCATGTVYAAGIISGGGSSAPSALYRATTASGTLSSLSQVTTLPAGASRADLATLDISPTDVNQVVVVSGQGDVYQTTDGGTTWTTLNSSSTVGCNATLTSCGRGFGAERPGDIEIAPATSGSDADGDGRAARSTQASRAVFGSGSGLYSTRLSSDDGGGPTVTVNANLSLTIRWTAVTGASKYFLFLYQGGTQLQGSPFDVGSGTEITTGPSALPNGTYSVAVAAVVGGVTGTPSAQTSFTVGGSGGGGGGGGAAPGTPGTPSVTVAGGSISVTWTAASGTVTSYQLAVTQGGTPIQGSPFNVGPSTSVGPVSGLPAGTYAVTVTALNGSTPGPASAAATFTLSGGGGSGGGGAAPGTPGTPSVTVTGGSISVAWTAASGTVTSYQLAVTQGGTPIQGSPFNVGPSTSVGPVSGLPAGTYAVTVTAFNGSTPGPASAAATFTLSGGGGSGGGGTAPGTPGTPSVTVTGGSVSVSWTAASGTVTTYQLAVTQGGTPIQGSPFNVGPSTTVGPVSGLPAGTYAITVTAFNGSTPGPASAAATFTISGGGGGGGGGGAAPGTPGTPQVTVTGGGISVSWTAASGTVTSYQLAVTQGGSPLQGSPFNVGPSTTVGPVSGLPPGTYAITVTAFNGSTPGPASPSATFTVP